MYIFNEFVDACTHAWEQAREGSVCVCVQNALMEEKNSHFLKYLYKLTE